MNSAQSEIIDFWFSDEIKNQWFSSTPELDNEILVKYGPLLDKAASGELDNWCDSAQGCLALIIILDQFPLNMFRGQAKSFKTEQKAVEIARFAVNKHFDQEIDNDKLAFLFMPFMHSEDIKDQDLSVSLYTKHKLESNIDFAKHHREIIRKFGRFPHRNQILGRISTKDEIDYLASENAFKG